MYLYSASSPNASERVWIMIFILKKYSWLRTDLLNNQTHIVSMLLINWGWRYVNLILNFVISITVRSITFYHDGDDFLTFSFVDNVNKIWIIFDLVFCNWKNLIWYLIICVQILKSLSWINSASLLLKDCHFHHKQCDGYYFWWRIWRFPYATTLKIECWIKLLKSPKDCAKCLLQ